MRKISKETLKPIEKFLLVLSGLIIALSVITTIILFIFFENNGFIRINQGIMILISTGIFFISFLIAQKIVPIK